MLLRDEADNRTRILRREALCLQAQLTDLVRQDPERCDEVLDAWDAVRRISSGINVLACVVHSGALGVRVAPFFDKLTSAWATSEG